MKKVLIVFGTRPEAIKLSPLIKEMKRAGDVKTVVTVFRQHGAMVDEILRTFGIVPDHDLPISISDKELLGSGIGIFTRLRALLRSGFGLLRFFVLLKRERPDLIVVQGDTSTVFLAAFLAFLFRISIAHVEAGLRTYDKYAPFPEEINRQLLGRLADIHFAPTEVARQNLLNEHVAPSAIHVVGNTEIDALLAVRGIHAEQMEREYGAYLPKGKRIILVTAHRRESFGEGLQNICDALKEIATQRSDVGIVYPVHPNPNVQKTVRETLHNVSNIFLAPPVAYASFVALMERAYLILTDSGGIQESAPALGKPVLVMREKTERREGVAAGVAKLVGTTKRGIVSAVYELLDDKKAYAAMTGKQNLYGDGTASKKIAEAIRDYLEK